MSLKRTASVALALAVTAGLAVTASAQGFGGGFGGPFGGNSPTTSNPMALLERPEVQNEIHLDLKQKNAIGDVLDQSQADMRNRMMQLRQSIGNGRNLSPQGSSSDSTLRIE